MTMQPQLLIALAIILAAVLMAIYASISGRRLTRLLKAFQPDTPLDALARRLASGEISPEQYQYERYLLEQKK
jgi:uncharacterized membrane protein